MRKQYSPGQSERAQLANVALGLRVARPASSERAQRDVDRPVALFQSFRLINNGVSTQGGAPRLRRFALPWAILFAHLRCSAPARILPKRIWLHPMKTGKLGGLTLPCMSYRPQAFARK